MTSRTSGVLLHPTSLPGPYGIGDLGASAEQWLDWLVAAGCSSWQILPLGPTGYADSPYQSLSSFSGNPLLIAPDALVEDGLVTADQVEVGFARNTARQDRVDFGQVKAAKSALIDNAWLGFGSNHPLWPAFDEFTKSNTDWLDDDSLFMALKDANQLRPWPEWPQPLRDRDPAALDKAGATLEGRVGRRKFEQWLFSRQWDHVRQLAADRQIRLIGDIPLYAAHDSSDAWVNRHLFDLDLTGAPVTVAGVPPDYFSETGQLWGNPTYDWEANADDGFRWWARRLAATLDMVDVVRLDHFRGIADYWAIPAHSDTAAIGEWKEGPGMALFDALADQLGSLALIAEDLGDLSARARSLLARLPFPGMKILQFAFDDRPNADRFSIDQIPEVVVAYAGTHDNDTAMGWFSKLDEATRSDVRRTLRTDEGPIAWGMVTKTWETAAHLAIAPIQDLLELDTEARMNTPGTTDGNWQWRLQEGQLHQELAARIFDLNQATGRSR